MTCVIKDIVFCILFGVHTQCWKSFLVVVNSAIPFLEQLVHCELRYELPYFNLTFCKTSVDIPLLNKLSNDFNKFIYKSFQIIFSSAFPSICLRIYHEIWKFQEFISWNLDVIGRWIYWRLISNTSKKCQRRVGLTELDNLST
jgi:hypothetical protein